MILYINTIKNDSAKIEIGIFEDGKKLAGREIEARYAQAEKLLPLIDKMLKRRKLLAGKAGLKDKSQTGLARIKEIAVVNKGGSFTSLRIGVVTANALGYALGIPVRPVDESGGMNDKKRKKAGGKFEPGKKSGKFSIVQPKYYKEPNITLKKS